MAVFIAGRTTCPLCGLLVQESDEAINFPPLFLNAHHDVFEISDSVVHRSCLERRSYSQLAQAKLAAYNDRRGSTKLCKICGRVISNPDDYFSTGPLSDDQGEEIARLDWFEAHSGCLRSWDGTPQLIDDLRHAARSDDWEGQVLHDLAERLEEIRSSEESPAK
jgi:hypothetical protein